MERYQPQETNVDTERAELLLEHIDRAQTAWVELQQSHDIVITTTAEKRAIEDKALELTESLRFIPKETCLQLGLPYHPVDDALKFPQPDKAFPLQPDYPLDYQPKPSSDKAMVDQEQPLAA